MASIRSQAARRYAEALLAACDDGEIESVATELSSFAEAVDNNFDLRNVLMNPTFSAAERGQTMEALMSHIGLSERSQKFINLLIARDRQGELQATSEAFATLVSERMNRATATVRTAAELDPSTQEQLKWALEKRTGKQLDMTVTVDPSLIGGLRAEVGTLVFDGSIKAELERLGEALRSR